MRDDKKGAVPGGISVTSFAKCELLYAHPALTEWQICRQRGYLQANSLPPGGATRGDDGTPLETDGAVALGKAALCEDEGAIGGASGTVTLGVAGGEIAGAGGTVTLGVAGGEIAGAGGTVTLGVAGGEIDGAGGTVTLGVAGGEISGSGGTRAPDAVVGGTTTCGDLEGGSTEFGKAGTIKLDRSALETNGTGTRGGGAASFLTIVGVVGGGAGLRPKLSTSLCLI